MNNIKSKDSMLNLRQKAIDYLPEGKSENYDKELSAINKGIVYNIERKLSLLGQLWFIFYFSLKINDLGATRFDYYQKLFIKNRDNLKED